MAEGCGRAQAESLRAIPVLEAIDQKAAALGVPVETRISPGRTDRHALEELIAHEPPFDRILVAAATDKVDGFNPADIAWLLEHVPGEIVVIRPTGGRLALAGNGRQRAAGTRPVETAV